MGLKREQCLVLVGLLVFLFVGQSVVSASEGSPPVVFVCEHGTVKSVMAVELFNQAAKERGLAFHAISRGIVPDARIPGKISEALEGDGFDVSTFEARKLEGKDFVHSSRIVAIGSDLSTFDESEDATVLQWDEIPPASVDYGVARAALLERIHALLDDLEAP